MVESSPWAVSVFIFTCFHLYALMYKPRNATRRNPPERFKTPEAYVPIGAPRVSETRRAGKPLATGAELLR